MTVDLLTNIHRELNFHKPRLTELKNTRYTQVTNWIVEHKVLRDHFFINKDYATFKYKKGGHYRLLKMPCYISEVA